MELVLFRAWPACPQPDTLFATLRPSSCFYPGARHDVRIVQYQQVRICRQGPAGLQEQGQADFCCNNELVSGLVSQGSLRNPLIWKNQSWKTSHLAQKSQSGRSSEQVFPAFLNADCCRAVVNPSLNQGRFEPQK